MKMKSLSLGIALTAIVSLPLTASAQSAKLVVQDSTGTSDVYTVNDDGTSVVQGADANNSFKYNFIGHTGGNNHIQLSTGDADSRFTFMAAENNDQAPRLAMTGPQDVAAAVRGWMLFDYGSFNYDLPNARFRLRHYNPSGIFNVLETSGRDSLSILTPAVGIGTSTPASRLQVVGLPSGTTSAAVAGDTSGVAGAVCITVNGNMYIDTDGSCAD